MSITKKRINLCWNVYIFLANYLKRIDQYYQLSYTSSLIMSNCFHRRLHVLHLIFLSSVCDSNGVYGFIFMGKLYYWCYYVYLLGWEPTRKKKNKLYRASVNHTQKIYYVYQKANKTPDLLPFKILFFFFLSSKLKICTNFVMKIKALDVKRTRIF